MMVKGNGDVDSDCKQKCASSYQLCCNIVAA